MSSHDPSLKSTTIFKHAAHAVNVVCVGHAALDYRFQIEQFPPTPQKVVANDFEPMVGGMGGNAAIARRYGARITIPAVQ